MKTKLIIQTRIKELDSELREVIDEIKKLKSDSVSGRPDFKQMETVDSFTKRVLSLKFAIVELEGINKLIDGEVNECVRSDSREDV